LARIFLFLPFIFSVVYCYLCWPGKHLDDVEVENKGNYLSKEPWYSSIICG